MVGQTQNCLMLVEVLIAIDDCGIMFSSFSPINVYMDKYNTRIICKTLTIYGKVILYFLMAVDIILVSLKGRDLSTSCSLY